MPESVEHPHHYGANGFEPWDFEPYMPASGSAYVDHLRMAALEYIWRAPLKGGAEDYRKAANVLKHVCGYIDQKGCE